MDYADPKLYEIIITKYAHDTGTHVRIGGRERVVDIVPAGTEVVPRPYVYRIAEDNGIDVWYGWLLMTEGQKKKMEDTLAERKIGYFVKFKEMKETGIE